MNIGRFSVKRPVTIIMVVVIMLMFGMVSLSMMSVDLLPDMDLPIMLVYTTYDGAGAEEVETKVTKVIEQQCASVSGIDSISSQSASGVSIVILQFNYGTDLNEATNSVRDALSMAGMLMPDGVGDSNIMKMSMDSMPIMYIGIASDTGRDIDEIRKIVDDTIAPRIERIDGVAAATVVGGNTQEVHITLDPDRLANYGLSVGSISQIIQMENNTAAGGYVAQGSRDILVRIDGEYGSLAEIGKTPITLSTGGVIHLSDIAEISFAESDTTSYVHVDGQDVVAVAVQKESDGNTVSIDKDVHKALAELEGQIYDDLVLTVPYSGAEMIQQSIDNVKSNLFLAAGISTFIIFMFLGNIRSMLIIGLAIPLSLITTFNLLYFGGHTLNMITLGALALSVGMIVDNSTVVLENIYRHWMLGKSRMRAAVDGTKEVTSAVVASTLTTAAVYLPMVFISGMAAEILKPFGLTICFAIFASLLVSLTLVPMMSSRILKMYDGKGTGFFGRIANGCHHYERWFNKGFNKFVNKYGKSLIWTLNHKKTSLLVVTLLLILSIAITPLIGMELIPAQDYGEVSVTIELPYGSQIDDTLAAAEEVEDIANSMPEVDMTYTMIGSTGGMSMGGSDGNTATMTVILVDKNERDLSAVEVAKVLEDKCSLIAGATVTASSYDMSQMSGSAIQVQLKGNDADSLAMLADEVEATMKSVEGTSNVTNSLEDGNDELTVYVNRERATYYNVSTSTIMSTVQLALNGATVSKYKGGADEEDIVVKLPDYMTESVEDLRALKVPSNTGGQVPLEEVANIERTVGQTAIVRMDQSRVVTISSDVYGRDLGSVSNDIKKALAQVAVPNGCTIDYGGSDTEMTKALTDIGKIILLAVVMVYGVMACQFENFISPLIIMFSVPVMFIGVFGGLLITGETINMMSMMGILLLVGVVVNNAIVLIDYVQVQRREGMCRREAIVNSGKTRMRPILMTTLTTVLAMLPQFLSNGDGAEMFRPMAVTVIFGLSFSTVISLFVVPIIYEMVDKHSEKRRNKKHKRNAQELDEMHEYTMIVDDTNCWRTEEEHLQRLELGEKNGGVGE